MVLLSVGVFSCSYGHLGAGKARLAYGSLARLLSCNTWQVHVLRHSSRVLIGHHHPDSVLSPDSCSKYNHTWHASSLDSYWQGQELSHLYLCKIRATNAHTLRTINIRNPTSNFGRKVCKDPTKCMRLFAACSLRTVNACALVRSVLRLCGSRLTTRTTLSFAQTTRLLPRQLD